MGKKYVRPILLLGILTALFLSAVEEKKSSDKQKRHEVTVQSAEFTESSRLLVNPNRGFYHMHGFVISDKETDYREDVSRRFSQDEETGLTMTEINLREYRDRELTEEGLRNVERLLEALSRTGKQFIIRFLYDWDGKNMEMEPDTIDLILTHMSQLEPVLKKYENQIFVVQGLFIGDVGEMHGSKYLEPEDTRVLAAKLAEVTGSSTFLAVRTPAHWRRITQTADPGKAVRDGDTLLSRMGLYNDGMLGSANDTGTYGTGTLEKDGPYVNWKREDELAFQDVLCRMAPLGGEVIIDNPCNDMENAIKDMSVTHVTYLNREHDSSVLDKWEAETISEDGCFDGMDGLAYMERHLGYRLVLREAELVYQDEEDVLSVELSVQNVGFAPVYRKAEASLKLYHVQSGTLLSLPFPQDVRELAGGSESEKLLLLQMEIPLMDFSEGTWEIYMELTDSALRQQILFGNEQEPEAYGYRIGQAELT